MKQCLLLRNFILRSLLFETLLFGFFILRIDAQVFDEPLTLIIVTGISGAEKYQPIFQKWSDTWREAGKKAEAKIYSIGENEDQNDEIEDHEIEDHKIQNDEDQNDHNDHYDDRELLREILKNEVEKGSGQLWIVLHGHGTFDGEEAKFNLRGRDFSSKELAKWLEKSRRPIAIVNAFSASAPFVKDLSRADRVIISATKSGYEMNYARFGGYVAEAIGNLRADLDKDGQVSLLEAFLKAARETEAFYERAGRLASEHALIEDSGDGFGMGADWYRGVRVIKKSKSKALPDGRLAHRFHLIQSEFERKMSKALREKRDDLELQMLELRDRKETFSEETYYKKLEAVLLKLASVYEKAEEEIAKKERSF